MALRPGEIEGYFRREYGRCVASLVRFLGDIDLAEEAVQEAFAVAVDRWPVTGLPPNPGAWITTTARNRAIDQLRREASRHDRHAQATLFFASDDPPEQVGPVKDERLRLIFTCCHPALARTAQVALTLRLLGGLETTEIARAFLVPEATMAQRIVRAKKKIRRRASRTGFPATPSCQAGSPPFSRSSTSSSTRGTRRQADTACSGRACARRPSGWLACWPS
jgi:RNA polymerase sigma-70 factor (ECF subfamily)